MTTNGRRLVIADEEAKMRGEETIVIDLGDAGEIVIDPPLMWRRRTNDLPKKFTTEQYLTAVVGTDQVELWLSTGRTLEELDHWTTKAIGMKPGESSASSVS